LKARAIAALLFPFLLLGVALLSNLTYRKRQQERAIMNDRVAEYAKRSSDFDRYVDVGVVLVTVVADPNGTKLVRGCGVKLRELRRRTFGGVLDTRSGNLCGATSGKRVWYCSEDQEGVLLHGLAPGDAPGQLVYGSEGAGKTTVTAAWHYLRWIDHLGEGRIGAQTAPTRARLRMVLREIFRLFPRAWYSYSKSEGVLSLCDGTTIEFVSTHKKSEEEGSRIQGQNWSWCAREEGQDQMDAHDDIESRGRSARDGRYQQLITATAKDASRWRAFRDKLIETGLWLRRTLLGRRSPFIKPSFWDEKKLSMSPREYARRVEAEDVPPELAVYYCWDRSKNMRARPPSAIDVTATILSDYQSYVRKGARFTLLACHDPGNIFNTTIILRLVMLDDVPTWFVVGELQTKQTTAREHALKLREYLQQTFDVDRTFIDRGGIERCDPESSKCVIFVDPHGKGESQTDYQTVYMAFQGVLLDVFSPAPKSGRIKRAARVEMVNRLLRDAGDVVRLLIALDAHKQPVAPQLVEAFETLEKRAGDDDPEGHRRKDESDKTHAPAALSYGLWPFEQEAFTGATIRRARAAARKLAA
jgi:hypothetical protein